MNRLIIDVNIESDPNEDVYIEDDPNEDGDIEDEEDYEEMAEEEDIPPDKRNELVQCPHCPLKIAYKNLSRHISEKHLKTRYHCPHPDCKASYTRADALKSHIVSHTQSLCLNDRVNNMPTKMYLDAIVIKIKFFFPDYEMGEIVRRNSKNK